MAPHRLNRRDVAGAASTHLPRTFRFRLIARTPTMFIDYLFELLLAFVAFISAVGYLSGFTAGASLLRLLPDWLAQVYSWVLLLGSVTVSYGLARGRYGTVVSRGLQLLAVAVLVYALSAIWYAGFKAALSTILFSLGWSLLAAWRSFILRSTYLLFTNGTKAG